MSERVPLLKRQYRWIYRRANDLSEWTQEEGKYHVHHIVPVGWATRRLGMDHLQYNYATNLIVLTDKEHDIIHPDVVVARRAYWFNPASFQIMFSRRRKLTDRGRPYWVTEFDNLFKRIAKEQTEQMFEPYPERT